MGKTIRRKSLQAMLNMCQEEEEGGRTWRTASTNADRQPITRKFFARNVVVNEEEYRKNAGLPEGKGAGGTKSGLREGNVCVC